MLGCAGGCREYPALAVEGRQRCHTDDLRKSWGSPGTWRGGRNPRQRHWKQHDRFRTRQRWEVTWQGMTAGAVDRRRGCAASKHRLRLGRSIRGGVEFGLFYLFFPSFIAMFVLTCLIIALLYSSADTNLFWGVEFVESLTSGIIRANFTVHTSNSKTSGTSKQWSIIQHLNSLRHVRQFVTAWMAARQASLSLAVSQSLLKLMSTESMMPSTHLVLCHPLILLPSNFPCIRGFSSKLALHIRWPKYWRHGEKLNAYYQVKEVNLKRPCTVWFQLDDILGEGNCDQWLPRFGEVGMNRQSTEDS